MKTIHIEILDRNSISKAITELEAVKAEWGRKANLCSEMIAAVLSDEIQKNLDAIPFSDDLIDLETHQPVKKISFEYSYAQGNRIYIKGQQIAFIEFGAGIYHNNTKYNVLSERVNFDTYTGSYGKGHGLQPYWFVAHNLISRGTPMYAPIALAIEAIEPQIPTLVRQVYV